MEVNQTYGSDTVTGMTNPKMYKEGNWLILDDGDSLIMAKGSAARRLAFTYRGQGASTEVPAVLEDGSLNVGDLKVRLTEFADVPVSEAEEVAEVAYAADKIDPPVEEKIHLPVAELPTDHKDIKAEDGIEPSIPVVSEPNSVEYFVDLAEAVSEPGPDEGLVAPRDDFAEWVVEVVASQSTVGAQIRILAREIASGSLITAIPVTEPWPFLRAAAEQLAGGMATGDLNEVAAIDIVTTE